MLLVHRYLDLISYGRLYSKNGVITIVPFIITERTTADEFIGRKLNFHGISEEKVSFDTLNVTGLDFQIGKSYSQFLKIPKIKEVQKDFLVNKDISIFNDYPKVANYLLEAGIVSLTELACLTEKDLRRFGGFKTGFRSGCFSTIVSELSNGLLSLGMTRDEIEEILHS